MPDMSQKSQLIEKYRLHAKDTGSTPFQLVTLQEKIRKVIFHLKNNHKDIPAKRAMLKKLARKKRFLLYLEKNHPQLVQELANSLK